MINGKVDGLGFVLGEGISGIDLDGCINTEGQLTEQAEDIVSLMEGTYLEFSPSGTGLHLLFKGSIPSGGNKSKDSSVEMYSSRRFFTVTGDGAGKLEERTEQAAEVFNKYIAQSNMVIPSNNIAKAVPVTFNDDPAGMT